MESQGPWMIAMQLDTQSMEYSVVRTGDRSFSNKDGCFFTILMAAI